MHTVTVTVTVIIYLYVLHLLLNILRRRRAAGIGALAWEVRVCTIWGRHGVCARVLGGLVYLFDVRVQHKCGMKCVKMPVSSILCEC